MEFKDGNGTSIRACSATLISSRHLLTASHCVLDIEKCFFCMNGEKQEDVQCPGYSNADKTSHPSSWTIAYGGHCDTVSADKLDDNCQEDNMKRIGVRAIAWDERFVNKCFEFDMAIIELERYIELRRLLSSLPITPVSFPV